MNTRYVRKVQIQDADFAQRTAEAFLKAHGFHRIRDEDNANYCRGLGFFRPPQFISINIEGETAILTAYRKHALLPGVFAMDVRRRSRRLEKKLYRLATMLSTEQGSEQLTAEEKGKCAVLSIIFGLLGASSFLFAPLGLVVSSAGLITGAASLNAQKKSATVGIGISAFFFAFSAAVTIKAIF